MTTQKKIIIALLTLIIIIAVSGIVMSYQKTERKYQACLDKCEILSPRQWKVGQEYNICVAECREKYGK